MTASMSSLVSFAVCMVPLVGETGAGLGGLVDNWVLLAASAIQVRFRKNERTKDEEDNAIATGSAEMRTCTSGGNSSVELRFLDFWSRTAGGDFDVDEDGIH